MMRFLSDTILGDLILVKRMRIPAPPPPSKKVYAQSVARPYRFDPLVVRLVLLVISLGMSAVTVFNNSNIKLVLLTAIFLFSIIGGVILDDVATSEVANTLTAGIMATSELDIQCPI